MPRTDNESNILAPTNREGPARTFSRRPAVFGREPKATGEDSFDARLLDTVHIHGIDRPMHDDFSQCMVTNSRMAARAITRRYDAYLRKFGLTATQLSLL